MIKISIPLLKKEDLYLHGEEPGSFLNLNDDPVIQVAGPVEYALNVKLTSGSVLVTGKVSCELKCICGRCLEEFVKPFKVSNLCLYFDELGDAVELDISDELRQEILLTLPLAPLCSNDCRGLCPVCGVDLNHASCSCDPEPGDDDEDNSPWSVLDNLKL